MTVIDWVDFILFEGITYLRVPASASASIGGDDVGPQFAAVQVSVATQITDPAYRARDGDAAFLTAGTPVYRLSGYEPSFRLSVLRDGTVLVYEADANPRATHGRDLLDVAGKVRRIVIRSAVDSRELGRIDNGDEVSRLVELVLQSPVGTSRDIAAPEYVVVFQLTDGTEVVRNYWPNSGQLQRGITLPPAFAAAVRRSVRGQ